MKRGMKRGMKKPKLKYLERKTIELLLEGQNQTQIAETLSCSQSTVARRIASVIEKLGAKTIYEAIVIWSRETT